MRMAEIRTGAAADIPKQKALWKIAFGDEDAYIDRFYANRDLSQSLLLFDGGVLCSMVSLLPMAVVLPDGRTAASAYIYALATYPQARGKGYARALLRAADTLLQKQGRDCVLVVPSGPSLHPFYQSAGFQECFSTRVATLAAAEGRQAVQGMFQPLPSAGGARQYNALRERLLAGTLHVSYPDTLIAYQQAISQAGNCGLFACRLHGAAALAAVEAAPGGVLAVKELLAGPGQTPRAAALLAQQLPAALYQVRTPVQSAPLPGSEDRPMGMVKWYNGALEQACRQGQPGYMGLLFD